MLVSLRYGMALYMTSSLWASIPACLLTEPGCSARLVRVFVPPSQACTCLSCVSEPCHVLARLPIDLRIGFHLYSLLAVAVVSVAILDLEAPPPNKATARFLASPGRQVPLEDEDEVSRSRSRT